MTADLDTLVPELARLDALILTALDRMRARYELSLDELRGLHITHERVDALLRPDAGRPPARPIPDVTASRAVDAGSRWGQVARMMRLDEDERDVLLMCVAPELDPKYETLFAYLNDDVARRWPTSDLAVRVLARDAAHEVVLRGHLLPGSRLTASGLVDGATGHRDVPRGRRALRAAPPIADWLRGLAYADERLLGIARFGAFERVMSDEGVPAAARAALLAIAGVLRAGEAIPPVVITASSGAEALVLAEDTVARAGRLALVADLTALRASPAPECAVSALLLAQRLLGVVAVAGPADALFDSDGRPHDALLSPLRRLIRESPALIAAAGPGVRMADAAGDAVLLTVNTPELATCERAAVWRSAWNETSGTAEDPARLEFDALADRFALGADRIIRAVAAARAHAELHGTGVPSREQLFAAARQISFDGDGGVTRPVSTPFEWPDLIVPLAVQHRLAEFLRAIELRSRVLDAWGFSRTIGDARGIKAMFAGPSGTGKTMAAALVAKSLLLPMARLELGTVVSKYIGETEKNLDRAFAAARRANAILFVDEADALLGKRGQVKDAHDRYANVEVAYLLQKMEDHDGIVIVATNLAQNIDEAFSRRMQFVIEFPVPDVVSRERLWRSMLPAAAPVAADVDVAFLARQFELAGGDIRNIALDAAYRAAQDDEPISLGHLLRAVAHQYAKRGRVPTASDFREHFALLRHDAGRRGDSPPGAVAASHG